VLTSLGGYSPAISAFGFFGHRLAGELADRHLCAAARDELAALNEPYSFATAGAWADKVRYRTGWKHTQPWHYINVEAPEFTEETRRNPEGDVLWAINHYEARLRDTSLEPQERREAMLFLTHFLVDMHQPLHVGLARDRGGNTLKVKVGDKNTNLHAVWDTGLLMLDGQSQQDYVAALQELALAKDLSATGFDPEGWLQESLDLRPDVYSFPGAGGRSPVTLKQPYLNDSKEIIDIRLAQAGIRLAGVMNDIWCPAPE